MGSAAFTAFFVGVFWVVMTMRSVGCTNHTAHEEMLYRLQFPGYDLGVRPNVHGEGVLVEVDLVLISIGPINEMDMTWGASFYLRQEWTDNRLVLGEEWRGTMVKLDRQEVQKLWVPDLFFSNNKEGHRHDLTVPNHLVYVNSSSGRMLYSQRLTVVLSCEMDLLKFPHDNQTCDMVLESYGFTTNDLILKWSSSRAATDLLPDANMPDFSLQGINTEDCTATYALGTYPCLKATVRMSREIGFYIFQTYLPSILIVILSWASFWIDHEAVPARISVGLLTVLTITTQLSGSRAQLPRVPYIKAIDVWMSMNLVFVFAAYMEYAVVTVLSRKYKKAMTRNSLLPGTAPQQESQKRGCLSFAERDNNTTSDSSPDPVASFSSLSPPESAGTARSNGTSFNTTTGNSPEEPSTPPRPRVVRSMSLFPVLDSKDTGRKVDKFSRLLFPLAFAIFNVIYWSYYLNVA